MSFLPPVRSYYLLKLITSGQNGSHRHSESTLCWHGFRLHNSGSLLSCFYLSSLSQLLSYLFVYLFTFTSEKKCKPFFLLPRNSTSSRHQLPSLAPLLHHLSPLRTLLIVALCWPQSLPATARSSSPHRQNGGAPENLSVSGIKRDYINPLGVVCCSLIIPSMIPRFTSLQQKGKDLK